MKRFIIPGIIFVFAFTILFSSYYVVDETQQVVITRFGKPVGTPILQAGIYFKIPLVDTANYFDRRILEWDGDMTNPIPTKDKKNIIVDTTARWRIVDPLKFLESVGNESSAQSRLDDIIDSNIRDIVSKNELVEIVRNSNRVLRVIQQEYEKESLFISKEKAAEINTPIKMGRKAITVEIFKKSKPIIEKYGVELIDVKIKGLMYSQAVLQTVFNRMKSSYGIKAQNLRSEGDRKKLQIEGNIEYEAKEVYSKAYKRSQEIRGEADAEAAKIYADALSVDPDFYQFLRSLESYDSVINKSSTIFMGTEGEFFKTLKTGK